MQNLKCFAELKGVPQVQVAAILNKDILDLRWSASPILESSQKFEFAEFKEGLWIGTCSEFFLGQIGGPYIEWNFAPNGNWACFEFESERKRSRLIKNSSEAGLEEFNFLGQDKAYDLNVRLSVKNFRTKFLDSLVYNQPQIFKLEKQSLYYAFRHGPDKPDFHNQKLWQKL